MIRSWGAGSGDCIEAVEPTPPHRNLSRSGGMTEFQTATLALQEAELEISRSSIRVGIGQIVAGVL